MLDTIVSSLLVLFDLSRNTVETYLNDEWLTLQIVLFVIMTVTTARDLMNWMSGLQFLQLFSVAHY